MRNFLTGKLHALAQNRGDVRLVVFVEEKALDHFRTRFAYERCVIELAPQFPPEKFQRKKWFINLCVTSVPTSTIWLFRTYDWLDGGSLMVLVLKRIFWFLGRIKIWRALLRNIEYVFFREDAVWKEYFDRYAPDAVFAPTGIYQTDILFLKHAKRRGVPSVASLGGWDYLSGKGSLRVHPDRFLVLNPLLKEEAHALNDMPYDRIEPIGFPQFDPYYDSSWRMTKEEVASRIGADSKKRWIGYFIAGGPLTSRVLHREDCERHIAILREARERGIFGNDVSLIVSVYPGKQFESTYVGEGVPTIRFGGEDYYSELDGLKLSINFIRHCDVVINIASSVSLEAALLDCPIVLAAFNDETLPWQRRLSVLFDHTTSFLQLQHTGGAWRAHTAEELIEATKTYLRYPELHREGRAKIVSDLVGPADGRANERIFRTLLEVSA